TTSANASINWAWRRISAIVRRKERGAPRRMRRSRALHFPTLPQLGHHILRTDAFRCKRLLGFRRIKAAVAPERLAVDTGGDEEAIESLGVGACHVGGGAVANAKDACLIDSAASKRLKFAARQRID